MELFYNPERMSETEIKETFVAHMWLVDEILSILKRQPKGAGVQHTVIVAPRGMGKTTLLLMLRFTVHSQDIAKRWQPVLFPEESYSVYDLADFWVEVLDHIASETGDIALRNELQKLRASHPDSAELEALALARIKDWRTKNKKRLMLLVDNFDMILEQIGDEKDNASLRDVLMNDGTMMLVGGSTTFFKEARAYEQPLYNLFKIYNLNGLDSDQIEDLLRRRAKVDGIANFDQILLANRTKLRVLEYFTGGNPRLVLMLYRIITQSQISEVRRGLEKLLDEVTPYYKAKIEALPPQQRKILDQIARISAQTREGLTPTEIASATRLAVNQVSSQLKRLSDDGYVRAANIRGRSSYYTLSEPLYAIWHQMRFSRDARTKMKWLVMFLKGWYDAKELGAESRRLQVVFRKYLKAGREKDARDALEHRRYLMEAIEDRTSRIRTFESIILSYLELSDVDTLKHEVLPDQDITFLSHKTRQQLIEAGLVTTAHQVLTRPKLMALINLVGATFNRDQIKTATNALTKLESQQEVGSTDFFLVRAISALIQHETDTCLENLAKVIQKEPNLRVAWEMKGVALFRAIRFDQAAQAFKRAIKIEPDSQSWFLLATTLWNLDRYEEALASFDQALQLETDYFEAHYGRSRCLTELGRRPEAFSSIKKALSLETDSAVAWFQQGKILAEMEKLEQALKSFDKAVALDPDDYDYLHEKVWTLISLNRTKEALQGISKMLELDPESADAYFLRAFFSSNSSEDFKRELRYALDLKTSTHNELVNIYGKPIRVMLSVMTGELDKVRSYWQEFMNYASGAVDQAAWLQPASDVVTFVAREGHWGLARELIDSSNLKEQLFPLARALDFLLERDETSIQKLSPEVRGIVDEIVTSLNSPLPITVNVKENQR